MKNVKVYQVVVRSEPVKAIWTTAGFGPKVSKDGDIQVIVVVFSKFPDTTKVCLVG